MTRTSNKPVDKYAELRWGVRQGAPQVKEDLKGLLARVKSDEDPRKAVKAFNKIRDILATV